MSVVLNYIIDRQENNRIDLKIYLLFLLHFQLKQKDVTELLARADDLSTQNKSYQEVKAKLLWSVTCHEQPLVWMLSLHCQT